MCGTFNGGSFPARTLCAGTLSSAGVLARPDAGAGGGEGIPGGLLVAVGDIDCGLSPLPSLLASLSLLLSLRLRFRAD